MALWHEVHRWCGTIRLTTSFSVSLKDKNVSAKRFRPVQIKIGPRWGKLGLRLRTLDAQDHLVEWIIDTFNYGTHKKENDPIILILLVSLTFNGLQHTKVFCLFFFRQFLVRCFFPGIKRGFRFESHLSAAVLVVIERYGDLWSGGAFAFGRHIWGLRLSRHAINLSGDVFLSVCFSNWRGFIWNGRR